jgi:pimeloyl-ACP methyl ester carboxylesterase
MTNEISVTNTVVGLWNEKVRLNVKIMGAGPALLYLPPADGYIVSPFLARVAEHFTVYIPDFPGTTPGNYHSIHEIDDLWDLVLIYEDLIRALDLQRPVLVGASFGGLLAAELGANFPSLFSQIVMLAPLGLWRDDLPVTNWIAAAHAKVDELLFFDTSAEAVQKYIALPIEPNAAAAASAAKTWAVGCAGTFIWPIPDKGLVKRLHRIAARTLIVWGQNDRVMSPAYAEEFGRRIQHSSVATIPQAGHYLHVEQADATYRCVADFLAEAPPLGRPSTDPKGSRPYAS